MNYIPTITRIATAYGNTPASGVNEPLSHKLEASLDQETSLYREAAESFYEQYTVIDESEQTNTEPQIHADAFPEYTHPEFTSKTSTENLTVSAHSAPSAVIETGSQPNERVLSAPSTQTIEAHQVSQSLTATNIGLVTASQGVDFKAVNTTLNTSSAPVVNANQRLNQDTSATELRRSITAVNNSATLKQSMMSGFSTQLAQSQPFQSQSVANALVQAVEPVTDVNGQQVNGVAHSSASLKLSQWGPVPISHTAPPSQQAQEMLTPLREQLRFQIEQGVKQAEVRLDPPELGKLDLSVKIEGDKLHVQLQSSNTSVREALLIGVERLRAELAQDHGGAIQVDVGQGEQSSAQDDANEQIIAAVDSEEWHSPETTTQANQQLDIRI